MYEYSEPSNQLKVKLLSGIDVVPDSLPVLYPYVPRICKEQGHMLIWYGTHETDSDLILDCLVSKNESQWITASQEWMIEKGVALVYPYEDEVILGTVKYAGYLKKRSNVEIRKFIRHMWKDLLTMFGDKKIICPTGSYLEELHSKMNNYKIPRETYHWKIMKQNGFIKHSNYWIRESV